MKRLIFLLLAIGLGSVLFPPSAFAKTINEVPGEAVYASTSEQDAIYKTIEESGDFLQNMDDILGGICMVKESITPVYQADFFEYARTGVFEIKPLVTINGYTDWNSDEKEPNYYMAKTVTPEGLFAGDIGFYIEGNVATIASFRPSQQILRYAITKDYLPSDSYIPSGNPLVSNVYYADHAEQIRNLTKRDSLVPANEVRFVSIRNVGLVFYINDGDTEVLIGITPGLAPELPEPIYYEIFSIETDSIVSIDENLKKIADKALQDHDKLMAEIQAWEAAHPGERYDSYTGSGFLSDGSASGEVWQPYLESDIEGLGTLHEGVIISIIAGSLLLIGVASVLFLRTRKQARKK